MAKDKIRTLDADTPTGFLYVLPMLALVIFFWIIPVVVSIVVSLTNYTGMNQPKMIGLDNYKMFLTDDLFYTSLKNTFIYVIGVVPGQTLLGFLVAAWVDRKGKTPMANLVRWFMFIPSLASTSVIGIICRAMLNNANSPLNVVLNIFGIQGNMLLGNGKTAMIVLIIIQILTSSGYYMVIYLSAMAAIPRSYYEAAKLEGVSTFKIYRRITIPILMPTTIMIVFLGVLGAIQTFDLVYVMTGGGPMNATYTIMLYLYMYGFKYSKIALSMAISVVLCIVVSLLVLWQRKTISAKRSNLY